MKVLNFWITSIFTSKRVNSTLEANSLISSISRRFTGNAIVISFHPFSAKYFAMETDETVIFEMPSCRNHSPTSLDWWVLKCGMNSTLFLLAFWAIFLMFLLAIDSSIMSVGLFICIYCCATSSTLISTSNPVHHHSSFSERVYTLRHQSQPKNEAVPLSKAQLPKHP